MRTIARPEPALLHPGVAPRAPGPPAAAGPTPAAVGPPPGVYAASGKRALDLGLLVTCLVPALALALPIALVNLALFRDPRRVLFLQERVGRDGRRFRILKFRTMREGPDAFRSWGGGHDGLRVTRFGRFLRNTHLDELPQLVNVLRGEMSVIGPRPEMVEIDAWACAHLPGFRERNVLRPGITGLAQVTQGYATMCPEAYARKLELDRSYVRRVSLALDLRILARTLVWMARGRGWSFHAAEERRAPRESEPLSRAA